MYIEWGGMWEACGGVGPHVWNREVYGGVGRRVPQNSILEIVSRATIIFSLKILFIYLR